MISAIVSVDKENGIGKDGDMLFMIPNDAERFFEYTQGKSIIMGRKTYDLIGEPLPTCNNIVVTSNKKDILESTKTNLELFKRMKNEDEEVLNLPSYLIISSIESVKAYLINNIRENSQDEIIIIGGEQVYNELLQYCDKVYMTRYYTSLDADKFFPTLDKDEWEVTYQSNYAQHKGNRYKFFTYERINKNCKSYEDGESECTVELPNE